MAVWFLQTDFFMLPSSEMRAQHNSSRQFVWNSCLKALLDGSTKKTLDRERLNKKLEQCKAHFPVRRTVSCFIELHLNRNEAPRKVAPRIFNRKSSHTSSRQKKLLSQHSTFPIRLETWKVERATEKIGETQFLGGDATRFIIETCKKLILFARFFVKVDPSNKALTKRSWTTPAFIPNVKWWETLCCNVTLSTSLKCSPN